MPADQARYFAADHQVGIGGNRRGGRLTRPMAQTGS